jgi:hypothetical protein
MKGCLALDVQRYDWPETLLVFRAQPSTDTSEKQRREQIHRTHKQDPVQTSSLLSYEMMISGTPIRHGIIKKLRHTIL